MCHSELIGQQMVLAIYINGHFYLVPSKIILFVFFSFNTMAQENEEKTVVGLSSSDPMPINKPDHGILLVLRLVAFFATASATIVMALNKETKTLVVATIGSTQVKVTLTAKFQHTPAFVFFVIANGMASLHNLLMIAINIFGSKTDYKGLKLAVVAILDMLNVALISGAANAAAFMAELGKNGNKHARWDKICDKFDTFCNHGGGALIASFMGLGLMLAISVISIIKLLKPKPTNHILFP
ncbi:DUF588 domain-containing protein [Cephalotus follicularis]|uniref:CASP-like protein n=1 Tax=Cephalotus follicularis TaxID=3775 RepID=A0A1Q3CVT1_CEPFO|nr:DUF588 domain-containing protein [Cephalotus follicularis]